MAPVNAFPEKHGQFLVQSDHRVVNLEFAEQRRANGVSTHPNSFSVPNEINGRLTHSNLESLSHVYLHIFLVESLKKFKR